MKYGRAFRTFEPFPHWHEESRVLFCWPMANADPQFSATTFVRHLGARSPKHTKAASGQRHMIEMRHGCPCTRSSCSRSPCHSAHTFFHGLPISCRLQEIIITAIVSTRDAYLDGNLPGGGLSCSCMWTGRTPQLHHIPSLPSKRLRSP